MILKREDNCKYTDCRQSSLTGRSFVYSLKNCVTTIPFPRNKHFTTNVQTAPFAKSHYHALRRFVCKHPIAGSVILWLNYYYKLFTKRSNAF